MGAAERSHQIETLCDTILRSECTDRPSAEQQLIESFKRREGDANRLIRASLHLLRQDQEFEALTNAAWQGRTKDLEHCFRSGLITQVLNVPLLQAMLRATPVQDVIVESLLVFARKKFFTSVFSGPGTLSPADLTAVSSLGCNAYLTDYVLFESAAETLDLEILIANLEAGEQLEIDMSAAAVIGCYRSLSALRLSDAIRSASWFDDPGPVHDLLELQIVNPDTEQAFSQDIPALVGIQNNVSHQVRSQYEHHSYPSWTLFQTVWPQDPKSHFTGLDTAIDFTEFGEHEDLNVLVAGCGTGRSTLQRASLWKMADITAMDLSRPSLAYAKRQAEAFGYDTIKFVHGDILELGQIHQRFDYIECGGVLHHMENPFAGLRALTQVCRPGGVIQVSLYSKHGRRALSEAKPIIRGLAKNSSKAEMRKARHAFIDQHLKRRNTTPSMKKILAYDDFYNLSMFHDLVFNIQEVDFDIPRVAAYIEKLGLRFCGFVDPKRNLLERYRRFAPNDPYGRDLDSWNRFEAQFPDTFADMYQFVVQVPMSR